VLPYMNSTDLGAGDYKTTHMPPGFDPHKCATMCLAEPKCMVWIAIDWLFRLSTHAALHAGPCSRALHVLGCRCGCMSSVAPRPARATASSRTSTTCVPPMRCALLPPVQSAVLCLPLTSCSAVLLPVLPVLPPMTTVCCLGTPSLLLCLLLLLNQL
jgi:hypothetical protein